MAYSLDNGEGRLTIKWMKKLLVVLALVSLTGSAAFAQRVHSDNQDFKFTAGVRIPLKNTSANSGEVMSLTYGKYNDKGFGVRGGVQWMFENMDINDYLGIPLSVSWSNGKRTSFKESIRQGANNAAYGAYHNKSYFGTNPDAGTILGSFFAGFFNRIEFFAGLTPGYIFGHREESHGFSYIGQQEIEHYVYIKNRFSLTADAGLDLSLNLWRFRLSVIPSFHYFITDNYREVSISRITHDGSTDTYTSDKAHPWQFAIQGGLSFSF